MRKATNASKLDSFRRGVTIYPQSRPIRQVSIPSSAAFAAFLLRNQPLARQIVAK